MTFDEVWPTLVIPGEFDAMDECDQMRWRGVLRQAFEAGREVEALRCLAIVQAHDHEGFAACLIAEGASTPYPTLDKAPDTA